MFVIDPVKQMRKQYRRESEARQVLAAHFSRCDCRCRPTAASGQDGNATFVLSRRIYAWCNPNVQVKNPVQTVHKIILQTLANHSAHLVWLVMTAQWPVPSSHYRALGTWQIPAGPVAGVNMADRMLGGLLCICLLGAWRIAFWGKMVNVTWMRIVLE